MGKCNHNALKKLKKHFKAAVYANRDSSQGEVEKVNVLLQRVYLVDDAGQTVQIIVNNALHEESIVI